MEIKEFIENFADQFDDTDLDVFAPETKFKELEEWSSLTTLAVVAMVAQKYKLAIKAQEIKSCETIQDLFDFICNKVD